MEELQNDVMTGGMATMEKLLKERPLKIYKEGDSVDTTVEKVTKNRVYVSIDGRMNGIVGGKELMYDPQFIRGLNPGDTMTAYVVYPEDDHGTMILSLRRAGRETIWADMAKKMESKEMMSVVVTAANKGGLIIEIGGIKGFLPVSQLAAAHYPRVEGGNKDEILTRLQSLVGKALDVKIFSIEKAANKLIFSEREAIGNRDVPDGLEVGKEVEGTVIGIVDFGFFVDVNGVEGLVHISEISWGKVESIHDFVKIGDKLKLKIIDIENSRLSLSYKQLEEDPWKKLVKELKPGDKIKGQVSRITPYGAFVKIKISEKNEIDALVHISEISSAHLSDPSKILAVGEEKDFIILSIDAAHHRLSLSLKALEEKDEKKAPTKEKESAPKTEPTGGFASLGATVIKKLNAAGIHSAKDLKGKSLTQLQAIEGIGEKTAEKIMKLLEEQ